MDTARTVTANDSFYLGAYWSARRESVGDCATRIVQFLRFLEELHSECRLWWFYQDAESAPQQIQLTIPVLESLLESHYDDFGNCMEALGFCTLISTTSGARFSINCGAYSDCSPSVNCCVLNFPNDLTTINDILTSESTIRLVKEVVYAMEPDWAVLNSHNLREYLDPLRVNRYVGVATYLSSRKFPALRDPFPPSKRIDIPYLGSIILLTEEPFSMSNPQHLAIAKTVTKSFRKQRVFKFMRKK